VSLINADSARTVEIVAQGRRQADPGSLRRHWYSDDPVVAFSPTSDVLVIRQFDPAGWTLYESPEEGGPYTAVDTAVRQAWNQLEFAKNPHADTYAVWDVETGIGFVAANQAHPEQQTSLESHKLKDLLPIAAEDAGAISNGMARAFAKAGHVLAVQNDQTLRICDFDKGTTRVFPSAKSQRLAFSADGKWLASTCENRLSVINADTGEVTQSMPHECDLASVAWAGERIACGDFSGQLVLWNPASSDGPTMVAVAGVVYHSRLPLAIATAGWAIACVWLVLRRRFAAGGRDNLLRASGN
jgi:hypothetical protein